MTREQFISHVEATQKAFRRFLVALCCGDSQLAYDVAQESYIKAYLACDTFTNIEKFNAWIFKIGYTTFLNHKRPEKIFEDYDSAKGIAADSAADAPFRYQALYSALEKLPGRERTSVLLFYMEGYQIKEIADIVEASTDAVKQYLSRGRKHLHEILKNE